MKKILAASGGIDSMVLIDFCAKKYPNCELVVATFDHGTRESSVKDADFVAEVCSALNLKFYRGEANLGAKISEEKAREKRYDFLRKIAFLEKGEIWTAHHLDDLIESIAINLLRGTGFRGLTPLNALGIRRPMIDGEFDAELGEVIGRREILKYAAKNGVRFRQDQTNTSDDYLRNRVRRLTFNLDEGIKQKIYKLWKRQKAIVREIDDLVENLIPEDLRFEREWFMKLGDAEALEILRVGLARAGISTTRPQRREFLDAIKTYDSGKRFNLPEDRLIRINKKDFML